VCNYISKQDHEAGQQSEGTMTAHRPSQKAHPTGRDNATQPTAMMRTDLNSMMLPLFAEDTKVTNFSVNLNNQRVKIHAREDEDGDDRSVAGIADKKLLGLLNGYVAKKIRSGEHTTRHIYVEVSTLMRDMFGSSVHGGADYARLAERLERLSFTVIEILTDLPGGGTRKRLFSWLDSVEYERHADAAGGRLKSIEISFSKDAFEWITRAAGIDILPSTYQSVGSSRASSWRVYEICLARLISSGKDHTWISLSELRDRIPITSELKVFKSRTLRMAMASIQGSDEISGHIKLHLARLKNGEMQKIDFSQRCLLSDLYVVISKGSRPLPESTPLLTGPTSAEVHKM